MITELVEHGTHNVLTLSFKSRNVVFCLFAYLKSVKISRIFVILAMTAKPLHHEKLCIQELNFGFCIKSACQIKHGITITNWLGNLNNIFHLISSVNSIDLIKYNFVKEDFESTPTYIQWIAGEQGLDLLLKLQFIGNNCWWRDLNLLGKGPGLNSLNLGRQT